MKLETEQDILDRYVGMKMPEPAEPKKRLTSEEEAAQYIGQSVLPPKPKPKNEQPQRQKRTPVWDLARLVEACRSAPIVWVALCEIAAKCKRRRFAIARKELAESSGILRLPTVTEALTMLEKAGWIRRSHVYRGDGVTWLSVALLKIPPNLARARARKPRRCSARKTLATAAQGGVSVAHDNRSLGALSCARKTLALSLRERERPSLARSDEAEADVGTQQVKTESEAT